MIRSMSVRAESAGTLLICISKESGSPRKSKEVSLSLRREVQTWREEPRTLNAYELSLAQGSCLIVVNARSVRCSVNVETV